MIHKTAELFHKLSECWCVSKYESWTENWSNCLLISYRVTIFNLFYSILEIYRCKTQTIWFQNQTESKTTV